MMNYLHEHLGCSPIVPIRLEYDAAAASKSYDKYTEQYRGISLGPREVINIPYEFYYNVILHCIKLRKTTLTAEDFEGVPLTKPKGLQHPILRYFRIADVADVSIHPYQFPTFIRMVDKLMRRLNNIETRVTLVISTWTVRAETSKIHSNAFWGFAKFTGSLFQQARTPIQQIDLTGSYRVSHHLQLPPEAFFNWIPDLE